MKYARTRSFWKSLMSTWGPSNGVHIGDVLSWYEMPTRRARFFGRGRGALLSPSSISASRSCREEESPGRTGGDEHLNLDHRDRRVIQRVRRELRRAPIWKCSFG